MLRYFYKHVGQNYRYTIWLAVSVIAIAGLVSLSLIFTTTWAEDTPTDAGKDAPHAHGNVGNTGTVTLTDKAKANINLKTDEADIRSIEKVGQVTGNVIAHPGRQALVTPKIGGIVKRIYFQLGDSLKAGDVLLELESTALQMAQIDLIEAVAQRKSLENKLAELTEIFVKQIRRELQTRQIDYHQSVAERKAQKTALDKHKTLAIAKTTSALEQMRTALATANVDLRLLETTLRRTKSLTAQRISAQKELAAQQAAYTKAKNVFAEARQQFHLIGVSDETLEMILHDGGETPILSLIGQVEGAVASRARSYRRGHGQVKNSEAPHPALQYVTLIDEATALADAEFAYKTAVIKVDANKQRALASGLTETLLENLVETGEIKSFEDIPHRKLIDNYLAIVASSEALEGLLQIEEAIRSADITLNKIQQQLRVSGLTQTAIEKIMQTAQPIKTFYVTAPASGKIVQQQVILGATVEKNDTLFSLLDTSIVWVEGDAYEDTLSHISVGSEVRIRVPAYPEETFTGKISKISAVMNPEKRTAHFYTEVSNPDDKLKPGMFAEQTVVIEKLDDVLSVPLHALLIEGTTQFVFVETGSVYVKHEIEVGAKDDRYVEIKDGLLAGERVVVQGGYQLMKAAAGTSEVIDPHAGHNH